MSKIKKVAIYIRKSRPDETEEALKNQLSALVELCTKNEWEFEVFQEIGSSQDINPELDRCTLKS
ncbi:recombinase family protein [Parageobacillus thermoglucosidasius]|uniref:recombinase family protein n=1 Tax=Parageobacillus thermoglucosidasius TaxID=1426 RepID=UPI0030C6767D